MSFYYYNEPLKSIISELKLYLEYKNVKINLMDHLPYLKEGYLLDGNEINMLFQIYNVLKDDLLKEYSLVCNNNTLIIKSKDISYSNLIIKSNQCLSILEMNKMIKLCSEADILTGLTELIINKDIQLRSHIPNIYEILEVCMNANVINGSLLNMITSNDNMKLIYNIIRGNTNIVKSILSKNNTCPFIAYSVSKLNNNSINDYNKSICIKRTWFIKQALINTDPDIIEIILDYLIYFIK